MNKRIAGLEPQRKRASPYLACARGVFFLFAVALSANVSPRARAQALVAPGATYEQRLGEQLPLDAVVRDETGRPRALATFFNEIPVVVVFGYFRCPQLCSIASDATIETLRALRADPVKSYRFLYISIDPTDTPAAAAETKRAAIRRFGRPGAEESWHYVTGSEATVCRIAAAAGFHYEYDATSRQYAHATGFIISTPMGVISHYFLGIDYSGKDVAAALDRAAEGKVGESVYELVLLCIHGGKISGPYGKVIWRGLQVASFATVLGLAIAIGAMIRSERRSKAVGGVA